MCFPGLDGFHLRTMIMIMMKIVLKMMIMIMMKIVKEMKIIITMKIVKIMMKVMMKIMKIMKRKMIIDHDDDDEEVANWCGNILIVFNHYNQGDAVCLMLIRSLQMKRFIL